MIRMIKKKRKNDNLVINVVFVRVIRSRRCSNRGTFPGEKYLKSNSNDFKAGILLKKVVNKCL